jgi:hypothetical protein
MGPIGRMGKMGAVSGWQVGMPHNPEGREVTAPEVSDMAAEADLGFGVRVGGARRS